VAVGDQTADALVAKLTDELAGLTVGPGNEPESNMGPLITQAHLEKVRGYLEIGLEEGADLVVDGRTTPLPTQNEGFFLGPCLFDRVTPGMRIYQEEIFGPVLCVVRAETMQQAMTWIDEHEYGNGTCLFTRDGEAARYFSDNIQVGMVGINVPLPVPVAYHSFGGWKRSLFGDLHAYGPDGVRFYTRRKMISQRWPSSGVRESAVYSFPSTR
jgi:malonate-semialdehyde dehydrogenase (acetylating)/methylmalonate-semialdehyde dehydrogenase